MSRLTIEEEKRLKELNSKVEPIWDDTPLDFERARLNGKAWAEAAKKVSDEERSVKYLHFKQRRSGGHDIGLLACAGSLGKPMKLVFKGQERDMSFARFLLETDKGTFGLGTSAYDPGFLTLQFLCAWREDGVTEDCNRVLFFDPQVIASIEKAGLSFMNPSRHQRFEEGAEVLLLDEYSAICYLKETGGFKIDFWPLLNGCLSRFVWCDWDFRLLGLRTADFEKMAKFDNGLIDVFLAANNTEVFDRFSLESFIRQRYCAYGQAKLCQEAVWQRWP